MFQKQSVAALYLDENDRNLWEETVGGIPGLVSIAVNGNLPVALETVRRFRDTVRVAIISARLYAAGHPGLAERLRGIRPGIELLLVSPEDSSPPLKPLFADDIRHLAIDSHDREADRAYLPAAVSMLVDRRPWDIGSCLREGTAVHSFQLGSSEDKEALILALEAVLQGDGEEMEMLRQKGALLADELLENAMYNAPRGADGDRLFRKGERRNMLPQERIVFSFGFDGATLALKLTDNWGSLDPHEVLEYLARNGEDACNADDAGGRGLFIIWRFLDRFHVNVQPGQQTAVGGHLQLCSGLDPEAPRGFHITQHEKEMAA